MGSQGAPGFRIEPLDPKVHDRAAFTCGVESLDAYLKTLASQDMRRKANAVFVLVPADAPATIAGFFTLCAHAISDGDVPEAARKWVPRYPLVSATLIGRLAVGRDDQRRGLGSVLLASALRKAYDSASVVGSCMVVVDAIDDAAASFYEAHGFLRLPDSPRLILPIRTIGQMLAE
jgi:GNAT superfamily N-acetyltransferase